MKVNQVITGEAHLGPGSGSDNCDFHTALIPRSGKAVAPPISGVCTYRKKVDSRTPGRQDILELRYDELPALQQIA